MQLSVTYLSNSENGSYIDFNVSDGTNNHVMRLHKDEILPKELDVYEINKILPNLMKQVINASSATTNLEMKNAVESTVFYL